MDGRTGLSLLGMAAALALAGPARAADEEIQVYMDEINAPGTFGLDVHLNTVAQGSAALDYPGAEASRHRWRITPEFSYALNRTTELGLYLPLATIAADGRLRVQGIKARLKWLAPHRAEGWYGGVNLEVGRVAYRLDQNPWNAELKLIGGWRRGRWLVGVNGNIDAVVAGPAPAATTAELGVKAGYRLTPGMTVGLESYNGLGLLRRPGRFGQAEHATYATLDTHVGRWDLNLGVGKGYGTSGDDLIVKCIIGVPI